MMGKRGILLTTFVLGLTLFLMSMVSATLVSPANSATISGTALLNATNTSLPVMLNCTFYAKSASTANSSWSLLGMSTNATANSVGINMTFNSASLQDSNDYYFNATCINSTALTSSVTSGITIDNTIPQAPTLSPATNTLITSATTQTFTGTVTDVNTTGCTYVIGRGGTSTSSSDTTSGTASYSTTTCTFTKTFSTSSDNGLWYWIITASDGSNTTASSSNTLNVEIPAVNGGLPENAVLTPEGNIVQRSKTEIGLIVIVVGAIALVILFVVILRRRR